MSRRLAVLMGLALAVPTVSAAGPQIDISGNTASTAIALPPAIAIDLSITFEQVSGLTADSLGLSAAVIDPTSASLLARLPSGMSIPTALPVLIAIEPPSTGGLTFNGVVSFSLHTSNLEWTPGTPLRLLAAPLGGSFVDITTSTSQGSYRAGANKGGFSEFLVAADLRPIDTVIAAKFDALQAALTGYASTMPPAVKATLQAQLDAAGSAYAANDAAGAANGMNAFITIVKSHSGSNILDQWRASRDVSNVAGELRAAASTLQYSLLLKAGSP